MMMDDSLNEAQSAWECGGGKQRTLLDDTRARYRQAGCGVRMRGILKVGNMRGLPIPEYAEYPESTAMQSANGAT